MSDFESRLQSLKDKIEKANNIVFFGGAGVSTESGIPDFRSKNGLYNQHDVNFDKFEPEYLLSYSCLYEHPDVFYEYYRQKLDCRGVEPNITHKKLAELEASGKNIVIVTQNIDGLHEKAGSKKIYNIHGTTMHNYCDICKAEFPADYIFTTDDKIPICPYCGEGMVRPDVTLYGETLPKAFDEAARIIEKADLMIVAGTSLTVYPASTLINYFKNEAGYVSGPLEGLIIINNEPTRSDGLAEIVFHENLGEIFSRL